MTIKRYECSKARPSLDWRVSPSRGLFLCNEGLAEYFTIPNDVLDITVYLSDEEPTDDVNYYRLKAQDFFGIADSIRVFTDVDLKSVSVYCRFSAEISKFSNEGCYIWIEYEAY